MTRKQWARFRFTFFLGLLFFIGLFAPAHAESWKDEVYVNSWCYDISIPQGIVDLDSRGEMDAADQLVVDAIETNACAMVSPPIGAAFRPIEEVDTYENFGGEPGVIIKGNLINPDDTIGRVAFVLVPLSKLGDFMDGEGAEKVQYQNI